MVLVGSINIEQSGRQGSIAVYFSQCSDDTASLNGRLPIRVTHMESTATCPQQSLTFKLEDNGCDLTWRRMGSARSTYPRDATYECMY